MADPFAAALAAVHGSPLAVDCIYYPGGGEGVPIRVVWTQGSDLIANGNTGVLLPNNMISIRRGDLSQDPAVGDVLDLDGNSYEVTGSPSLDAEGLSWTVGIDDA